MALSKEELLIPRYKVIADWPGVAGKVCVGDIFKPDPEDEGMFWIDGEPLQEDKLRDYPHLFKKLGWANEREDSDLPEYVRELSTGKIFKVASPDKNFREWHVDGEIEHRTVKRHGSHFYLPADASEYQSFIQHLKPL